ncbi:MAG: sigma-54-dependent Fis family transcriptional regulator [Planctomycetes bacterium]|nr:sigma-54-dependent Fis family transcriptional regulator [Planctomycetota bacterium]
MISHKKLSLFSRLSYCNPFTAERFQIEKSLLGAKCKEVHETWHIGMNRDGQRPNISVLVDFAEEALAEMRSLALAGKKFQEEAYEDLISFYLYHSLNEALEKAILEECLDKHKNNISQLYDEYLVKLRFYTHIPGVKEYTEHDEAHLFAIFFQLRRAFHYIFNNIAGGSLQSTQLRSQIWNSIFTHDMRRYLQGRYSIMSEFSTMITGPSGTGKELVASAICHSQYIPFDFKKKQFADYFKNLFIPVNLSAFPKQLIESELFGHEKGSFTGALSNRVGWFESCSPYGAVFLDEIGELSIDIQVKLLRLLQSRVFQRVGSSQDIKFSGKILVATNRDLNEEMNKETFRSDLYYRLCSDRIVTPSLSEILAQSPNELEEMVYYICQKVAPLEAESLSQETVKWVTESMSKSYSWPGNFRELEQCVRSVLIRKGYEPMQVDDYKEEDWLKMAAKANLTADELMSHYCKLAYEKYGNFGETAKKLKLDSRTVKAKIGTTDH